MLIYLSQRRHWQRYNSEILSKLNWVVNQFGFGLREINEKTENSYIGEMATKLAKPAIYSLSKDMISTAETCVTLLHTLANAYMASGSGDRDHEAPRIMVNVYIIGVIALHKKNSPLLSSTKLNVVQFRDSYAKKFFPEGLKLPGGVGYIGTYPEQINYEIARLARKDSLLAPGNPDFIGEESPLRYANRLFPDMSKDEYLLVKKYYRL